MIFRNVISSTKAIFALTLGSLILMAVCQRQFGTFSTKYIDFDVYFFTAQLVHDNPKSDLYVGALNGNPQERPSPTDSPIYRKARQAGVDGTSFYLYPPLLADMLVPLAGHSEAFALRTWRLCNLVFLATAICLTARMLNIERLSPRFLIVATGFYCFSPITECIALGQVTISMLALYAIGIYSFGRNLPVLSAIAIALATVLKVTPLMVLPLFFIWGQWRWLSAYISALATIVVGMGLFNGWHTLAVAVQVLSAMSGSVPGMWNKCIGALIAWVYHGRVFTTESYPAVPPALAVISKLGSLAFYGSCVFFVWRTRRSVNIRHRMTIFAMFALVALLTSPVSWRHAYAMALPAFALLWEQDLCLARSTRRTVLLAISSFSAGSIVFDVVARMSSLPQPFRILFASVGVVSSVWLCCDVLLRGVEPPAVELPTAVHP